MTAVYSFLPIMQRASLKNASQAKKGPSKVTRVAIKGISKSSQDPASLKGRISISLGQSFLNFFARLFKRSTKAPKTVAESVRSRAAAPASQLVAEQEEQPSFTLTEADKHPVHEFYPDGMAEVQKYAKIEKTKPITVNKVEYQIAVPFERDIDRDMNDLYMGEKSFYEMNKDAVDSNNEWRRLLEPLIDKLKELDNTKAARELTDQSHSLKVGLHQLLLQNQLQEISRRLKPARLHLLPQIATLMCQNSTLQTRRVLEHRYPVLYCATSREGASATRIVLDIPENVNEPVTIKTTVNLTYTDLRCSDGKNFIPLEQPVFGIAESTYKLSNDNGTAVVTLVTSSKLSETPLIPSTI